MSDFTYDSDDLTAIRTAANDLRNRQMLNFFAVATGGVIALAVNMKRNGWSMRNTGRNFAAILLTGGIGYKIMIIQLLCTHLVSSFQVWCSLQQDQQEIFINYLLNHELWAMISKK